MKTILYMWEFLKWLFSIEGSTVIYNLGLGIGSLFGGLAGLRYIREWGEKQHIQRLVKSYRKRYSRDQQGETGWELMNNPNRRGHLFVIDHRNKTRRWIANWPTFQDIFGDATISPNDERTISLFNQYRLEDHIKTQGQPEP